ncbi:hypothetical protein CAPTEDRAFT_217504 [Capitella teleta]|uniref:SUEL-type lectin domain-containing protein n=1 Tax=Capitella teleta TaxID=283909 RepID=R7UQH4_CAPTE|nr:hypothetical protein CAPTEDRAFT_217504 [Capitella teleta]|eukprot:ELU05656.1 hypothetical protein CAPTEDRAFT_217504 [Capitella teleta]
MELYNACNTWNYLVLVIVNGLLSVIAVSVDYCSDETFQASCSQNQVIVMTEAKYGRMQMGKCVKSDLGFLGCQVDALSRMDEKCSGKARCETAINDAEFTSSNPCSEELKMYLRADYSCVRVMSQSDICAADGIIRLRDSSHVIASRQLASLPCFTSGQRWTRKIQASTGQQINVTLIDLEIGATVSSRACEEYGHVTDAHTKQSAPICSHGDRRKTLLISNSNILDLNLRAATELPNFALKLEVLGCPDIKVSSESLIERNGDSLTVRCLNSKQTWNLNCVDNHWQGSLGNCSLRGGHHVVAAKSSNANSEPTGRSLSTDIAISLIACVAILICVVVIAVGVNCWKRHSLKTYTMRMQQEALQHALQATDLNPESEYMMPNYRQRDLGEEGVDALYDFCYMPSTSKPNSRTGIRPNNLNSMQTMPVREQQKINNATVRFQTHSPKLLLRTDHKV